MQRRSFRAMFAASAGLAAAFGLAVPAFAATSSSAPTVPASISGNDTTAIGQMEYHATNITTSPGAATGYFAVQGDMLPVTIPGLGVANQAAEFTLAGPVTCLDVQGTRAGFIYPITKSSGVGNLVKPAGALYITVQAKTATQPAAVGFAPMPDTTSTTCPPLAAFLTAESGTITVTPAH